MPAKFIKVLWILTIALSLSGCKSQTLDSAIDMVKPTVLDELDGTVAIVLLEDQIVRFECVYAREDCIPDVDIKDYALLDWPYHLGPVLYHSPSSIYMILYTGNAATWESSIVHYNPQSREIKSIKLPGELKNLHLATAGGRLILVGDAHRNVYIVDDKLSITSVEVGSPIHKLLGANDHEVIALNQRPVEKDGEYFIEVYVIDSVSGQFIEERLKLPGLELVNSQVAPQAGRKYLANVEGISRDLKYLYCLYFLGDEPGKIRLGTFDIKTSKEVASTQDPGLVRMTSGYAQYHEFLYTSYVGNGYGVGASLIDMSTVSSLLVDYYKELGSKGKLIIVPMGRFFLLNTTDYIIRLSQSGAILDKYQIPEEWIDEDYRVMYFMD